MATVHAAGVLLTHGDRALFLKRSDDAQSEPGKWAFPFGSVENTETAQETALRETAEETGITGLVSGNLNLIDDAEGYVTFRYGIGEEVTPTLNTEHTEFKWASLDDPPQPLHPGVAATLKKFAPVTSAKDAEFKEGDHPRNTEGEFAPVATLTGSELGDGSDLGATQSAARQYAETHLIGKTFRNRETGHEISVTRTGIKHAIAQKSTESLQLMPALPQLLEEAKYLGGEPDRQSRPQIKAVHHYRGDVQVGSKRKSAHVVVREGPDGHFHYDHFVWKEESPSGASDQAVSSGPAHCNQPSLGPNAIMADEAEESNSAADRREWDENGWFEVLDNPLSKVGVYQYSEASIRKGGDRNKMVGVYRPAEELGSQECINSFRLMPWTDDHPHDLFGDPSQGFATTEEKGVRGVIGEKVYFKDGTLYGNLKIFSEQLARKIAAGKRELSCGYHCQFLPQEGVYEGTPYQYVQKNMRGNHVSSVDSGRMGSGVRVRDAAEHALSFALDLKESPMAREDEIKDCLDADTERFICDSFNSLVGELEKKGYSKSYATKVAGKVAAEKGMTGHDSKSTGVTTVADKTPEELKKEKDAQDRKSARDSKRSSLDAMRAKDSMSAEEEEATDATEAACDAEEEKDDEKDESKEAKDRGRARDRRAGARDARKGARDKSARDAKAALDAAKGKGMDAAAVTEMVNKAVAAAVGGKALDATEITRQVTAAVVPAIRKEESAKAALYGRISPVIGAFDHSEMTHTQMAAYGLKKLGVAEPPADPVMALDFMLAGRNQVAQPGARAALDSATPSSTDTFFDSLN